MELLTLAAAGPLASAAYRLETTRIINETELLHTTSVLRLMTPSHLKKFHQFIRTQGRLEFSSISRIVQQKKKKYLFIDMAETDDTQNNANIYLKA